MSRNIVAIVSAALFVVLAAGLVFIPVPFVAWRPGQTVDVLGSTAEGPLIEVSGVTTSDPDASLLMTTVSTTRVDASISLLDAVIAHLADDSDALPRQVIYPAGVSNEQVQAEAVAAMDTSRSNATVAALRAAGQAVTEMPVVSQVYLEGPANGHLLPGDLIEAVNGTPVANVAELRTVLGTLPKNSEVTVQVLREGTSQAVTFTAGQDANGNAMLGIVPAIGYRYAPSVTYRIDSSIVGPSAGLVFALAVYDRITDGILAEGSVVAGTGTMDAAGKVGGIGGVREKIKGAESAGATVFLLPTTNCEDVGDLATSVRLVPVDTLQDAIAALQLMNEGQTNQEVPTCG